jgi:hypothetical protein
MIECPEGTAPSAYLRPRMVIIALLCNRGSTPPEQIRVIHGGSNCSKCIASGSQVIKNVIRISHLYMFVITLKKLKRTASFCYLEFSGSVY